MLNEHLEVKFLQLPLNYIDWTSHFVEVKRCYEVCVSHNVKGGELVNLPSEAEKGFKEYNNDLTKKDILKDIVKN